MVKEFSPSAETIVATRDLLCQLADLDLHAEWSDRLGEWDLDDPSRRVGQRKQDYLTLLRMGRLVAAALDDTLDLFSIRAQQCGASFGEIGEAQGVSRQAARQRTNRMTARRSVTLVGGPHDGQKRVRTGTAATMRLGVPDPWRDPNALEEYDEQGLTAVYRVKYGSPGTFEFQYFTDSSGQIVDEPDRRPRVHQIARRWGIDSRTVLQRLRTIDPRVRSASSRVDLATVEQLNTLP